MRLVVWLFGRELLTVELAGAASEVEEIGDVISNPIGFTAPDRPGWDDASFPDRI